MHSTRVMVILQAVAVFTIQHVEARCLLVCGEDEAAGCACCCYSMLRWMPASLQLGAVPSGMASPCMPSTIHVYIQSHTPQPLSCYTTFFYPPTVFYTHYRPISEKQVHHFTMGIIHTLYSSKCHAFDILHAR